MLDGRLDDELSQQAEVLAGIRARAVSRSTGRRTRPRTSGVRRTRPRASWRTSRHSVSAIRPAPATGRDRATGRLAPIVCEAGRPHDCATGPCVSRWTYCCCYCSRRCCSYWCCLRCCCSRCCSSRCCCSRCAGCRCSGCCQPHCRTRDLCIFGWASSGRSGCESNRSGSGGRSGCESISSGSGGRSGYDSGQTAYGRSESGRSAYDRSGDESDRERPQWQRPEPVRE